MPASSLPPPGPPGTQSIERAVETLRVLALRGRSGMRMAEVVAKTGLAQSTCFRLLARLEAEGLVVRDARTKKYLLGPLLHELGLLARPRHRLSEVCDGALHRLAEASQDTVYLSERSGLEAVCANRAMGDYPIKILELEVGVRRPLGVGAGGLAILCRMQPAEADGIIRANDHRYEKFAGFTSDFVRKSLALGVERGYTFLEHVVTPGSAAIGVAFPPQNPVGAISIAALATRLDERRRAQLAEKMQREVEGINAALAQTSA